MIRISHSGDFKNLEKFLKKTKKENLSAILSRYGDLGVRALKDATPKRSGQTASSWGYEVEQNNKSLSIYWTNSNINQGVNVAILIQYGHGTRTGGYVSGIDYINPSMKPIFEQIATNLWKEVTSI